MPKFLLVAKVSVGLPNLVNKYLKPRQSYNCSKMPIMALLTLNFDQPQVNSHIWLRFATSVPNLIKIRVILFEKSQQSSRTKKRTNRPRNSSDDSANKIISAVCVSTYYAGFSCFLWRNMAFVVPAIWLPNQCITIGYLISWNAHDINVTLIKSKSILHPQCER